MLTNKTLAILFLTADADISTTSNCIFNLNYLATLKMILRVPIASINSNKAFLIQAEQNDD